MTVRRAYEPPDKSQRDACLVEPHTGLEICLVEYTNGARQPFDEFVPGLDHLEFLVADRMDLDEWVERLDTLGIVHSGVKEPPYTANAILTFRDPDNIQLEFFSARVAIVWRNAARLTANVQEAEVLRAVGAAVSIASALDLTVDDAVVLQNSNRIAVRLLPCDVLARVALSEHQVAQFEVELALRLAETESPVAALEPRVDPRVYHRDGLAVTLWTYYEPLTPRDVPSAGYARALKSLHAGMGTLDVATPHFTDRVAEAQRLVASRALTPALADADRKLLGETLQSRRRSIGERAAAEQLLHGEPHPGNVLNTTHGPLFIDLETCCRGPVEFDLAHVPEEVSEHYADADQELLGQCRGLVLAMVAAWRWQPGDQFPNGPRAARALLAALHTGPPWPTIDVVMGELDDP